MKLVLNDENMQINEISEFNSKVRAILIDEENRVLIANYGGVFLFPGGSIDAKESINEAIIRELREETGMIYEERDLTFLAQLDFFQKNYMKRNGMIKNRLIRTYYFIGNIKKIELKHQCLTEKEKKDGFKLELVPLSEFERFILNNQNDNFRNIYFQREMIEIIKLYRNSFEQNILLKNRKIVVK